MTMPREAAPDEIPANARKLAALAEQHGWAVRVTYAEGETTATARTASRSVTSVAVRVRRGIFGAYALFTDGRFAWAGSPYRTFTLTEFKLMIEGKLR